MFYTLCSDQSDSRKTLKYGINYNYLTHKVLVMLQPHIYFCFQNFFSSKQMGVCYARSLVKLHMCILTS